MSRIEKFTIVEREPLELISDIASGKTDVWQRMRMFIQRTGMIKDESTLESYECLHGMFSYLRNMQEYV